MCKVSEETILKANERMRKYKIGQNNKNVSPMEFTVDTHSKVRPIVKHLQRIALMLSLNVY